jgi:hypothetical protein
MTGYTPTTWVAGTTKLNPTNMNHLEQGIAAALAASDYTAANVLAKLLTVDGAGTGIDADKLDGKELAAMWADTDILVQKANSGYIKLKNGLQIAWGSVAANASSGTTLFYTTFPTSVFNIVAGVLYASGQYAISVRVDSVTNSQLTWTGWQGNVAASVGYIQYIAFGY